MTKPISTLVAHARQGDARAIAQLLAPTLAPGVVARGQWRGTMLYLDLEADTAIAQNLVVPHIRRGLLRLGLTCPIDGVWVAGRRIGSDRADWQEHFSLQGRSTPTDTQAEGAAGEAVIGPTSTALTDEPADPAAQPLGGLAAAIPSLSDRVPSPVQAAAAGDRVVRPNTTLVVLAHLGPLVSYLALGSQWLGGWPLLWGSSFLLPWRVVAPLALLLTKGSGSVLDPDAAFVQRQAQAALNFQLTMLIAWSVTIALMFVLVGFLLVVPLALIEIVSCIVATTQAAEGKPVRYAIAIRFVR